MPDLTFEQKRITHADGQWADVSIVRCPAGRLRFSDLSPSPARIRLRDAAYFRYSKARIRGEQTPEVIAWACLENDRHVQRMFPTLNTISEEGEHFLSANAFITYFLRELLRRGWLRWRTGDWYASVPAQHAVWEERAVIILHWLMAENRLWLETGPQSTPPGRTAFEGCDSLFHLTPVGRCGYVRDAVREHYPAAAFNSSFFLLERDDLVSHHSALGDPYGLLVENGTIIRPPLYRRTTLWRDATGRWQIGTFGMEDVRLHLPGEVTLYPESSGVKPGRREALFAVNPPGETPVALYTRHFGVDTAGYPIGYTPASKGRFELTIIDRAITAWQRGGNLLIPQNGFVISFAAGRDGQPLMALGDLSTNIAALRELIGGGQVRYSFWQPHHEGMFSAQQAGPQLIADGEIVRDASIFAREEYWISAEDAEQDHPGIVPTDFPIDLEHTRAARLGIGIDSAGDLVILAVSGTSRGIARPGIDSAGATLLELAGLLQEAGAVQAINLDGGGSVQLFAEGGLYNIPGDRRGRQGVVYERLVPTIGLIE